MELDSEVELIPQMGKEREKSPVEQNPHKEVPYSKGKSQQMPIISEQELELSMSNSNRYKNIQKAQIDIYMSHYKQYYTVYKDKDWEILPQIHQGVMNSWQILKRFLKEEEIVRYSNGWNPLTSKPQIKNIKYYHAKKKEATKEEAPVAPTSNPQANHTSPSREEEQEKEREKTIFPKFQDSKNPKRCHGKFLQHGQNLHGIKGQGVSKMLKPHFPKK
ncbi:hypothetical protein O181_052877 [Austropuccinia psidii MF-1]|uniref:Uncharacterized protein n=1 Tax=Austropuccinia psidii MF-1 TaxID=1389203 RepID=A0A9Q3HQZ8_9BASI|nr:hypothetical protein [Austropuccinia psidii MF-1]